VVTASNTSTSQTLTSTTGTTTTMGCEAPAASDPWVDRVMSAAPTIVHFWHRVCWSFGLDVDVGTLASSNSTLRCCGRAGRW
jgi:hypothetical protein